MKFPEQYCIPTSLLTRESYSDLICKLVSGGYVNLIPHLSYDLMICWNWLGVGRFGEINTFNHPHSFMEPNDWMDYRDIMDEHYPNVWSRKQLEEYLK